VLRPLPHSTERYKSVFRQAGYPVHSEFDAFPYVHIPSDVIDNLAPLIQRLHRPLIGFAPFAKHPAKTLPIDQSESLIDLLANKFEILLLGGKSDEVHFSKWVDCHDHVHSLAHFNLQEQLAIMLKMQAVISMDSANMHLAAIQGTPVLSIWGGTHPYFGFYGIGSTEKNWVLAEPAVACSPCSVFGNRPCSNKSAPFTCFKQINTEKIVNRLEKILDRQIKE
jgi:ADP-heptose:LPS heptosyltransferase